MAAIMKFALIILGSMCLGQNTAEGHAIVVRATDTVQEAIANGMAQVSSIANTLGGVIVEGNRLLHAYSDNSTDYAAAYRIDIIKEITTSIATIEKAFADASATVNASNSSVMACFAAELNSTKQLAINLAQEVVKCGITKVRQFVDLGINLALLGNTTLNLVPNTNLKMQECNKESMDVFKLGCIVWQGASATAKLAEIAIGVGTIVTTATTLYGTVQADLVLCASTKLFGFRQTIVKIPLTVGVCTGKAVLG